MKDNDFGPVRLATAADEDEVFGLLLLMHAENGVFSFDRDKVRAGIRSGTQRRGGLIGVIEEGNRIVASVGLFMAPGGWYTEDTALFDMWNFVHPDHRRSNHAKALIAFSKKASDQLNHLPLMMAVVSNIRTAGKCRFYRRQQLRPMGEFFVHNLPPEKAAPAPAHA